MKLEDFFMKKLNFICNRENCSFIKIYSNFIWEMLGGYVIKIISNNAFFLYFILFAFIIFSLLIPLFFKMTIHVQF